MSDSGGGALNPGRPITYKSSDGMLHSKRPIGDVLRKKLGTRASNHLKNTFRFAGRDKWPVYTAAVFNKEDRELDDKLAHDLHYIIGLPPSIDFHYKVMICDPKTVQKVSHFKNRPVELSNVLGYAEVTEKLFEHSQPVDIRRKWYEIFNHVIDVDQRAKDFNNNAFSVCIYLASLMIGLKDNSEASRALMDRLWLPTKRMEDQRTAWLSRYAVRPDWDTYNTMIYYNDKRLMKLLDKMILKNRDLMFRNKR